MFRPGIVSAARPQLVHDLARLLGRLGHLARALEGREDAQRGGGEVRAERQQHPGRPDRVATEQREEPGGPGGEEDVVRAVAW